MTSRALKDATFIAPLSPSPTDRAIYVYAFVDAARSGDLPRSPDADREFSLHRVGAIGAVIHQVAAGEFCGIGGERNLADPAWILPRIRRHEAVVESAMQWSPVFPMRFATLYNGLDSLADFMRRHEAEIAGFLRQAAGQQEWALKVTAELDDLATLDELAMELWLDWSSYSRGKRYLRLRQERALLRNAARERASSLMLAIVDGLRPLTTAVRPLVRSAASQGSGHQHVENFALLASVGGRAALHDRLNELAAEREHRRFHIALSGPWPPYSFRPALDEMCPRQGE